MSGLFGGGDKPQQQQPTSTTVTNTNLPAWAQPYSEKVLGQASALTDINQNPYQQYGGQRLADFTPMQQQAFNTIGGMQVSPQNQQATNLAGAAGLGSLGAGQQYNQMATNPGAVSAFMSPYQQNVTDYQKQQAVMDYGRQLPGQQAQATNAGAFGGSRHAIVEGEGQRNLQNTLAGIQATGSQNAFNNAQQSMQFGTNAGLQGYNQALQGANTLGQLGQSQYQQQMGINAAQQQAGAQQQAFNQQGLTNQYQDFLNRQNYPYQQLGFMSDILHGTPTGGITTQQNSQVAPSMFSNIAGLGQLGLGAAAVAKSFREGGAVSHFDEGGIASLPNATETLAAKNIGAGKTSLDNELALGGDITRLLMASMQLKETQAELEAAKLASGANPQTNVAQDIEMQQQQLDQGQQAPQQGMPPQGPTMTAAEGGLASLPSYNFNPENYAGGGIIAFPTGGAVDPDLYNMEVMDSEARPLSELDEAQRNRVIAERTAARDAAKLAAGEAGKPAPAPVSETIAEGDTGVKRAKELANKRMSQTERDALRNRAPAPTPGVIEPDATLKASAKPATPAPAPAGLAATPEGLAAAESTVAGNPAVAKEVAKLDARIAEGVKRGKDMSKLIAQRAALTQGIAAAPAAAVATGAAPAAAAGATPAAGAANTGLKSIPTRAKDLLTSQLKFPGLGGLARAAGRLSPYALTFPAAEYLADTSVGKRMQGTDTAQYLQGKLGDVFDYFDPDIKKAGQTATAQVTPQAIETQKSIRAVTPQADEEGSYPRQRFAATVETESRGKHTDKEGNLIRPLDKNGNPLSTAQGITQLKSDLYPIGGKPVEVVGGIKILPPQDNSQAEFLRAGYDIKNAYFKYYKGDTDKTDLAYFKGPEAVNKAVKEAEKAGKPEDWVSYMPSSKKGDMSNADYLASIQRGGAKMSQKSPAKIIEKAKEVAAPVVAALTPDIMPEVAIKAGAKAVEPSIPKAAPNNDAMKNDAANAAFAKAEEAKAKGNKVDADKYFNIGMALLASGAGTLANGSPFAMQNIGKGIGQGVGTYAELSKQDKAEKREEQRLAESTRAHRATEANNQYRIFESGLHAAAKNAFPNFEQLTPDQQYVAEQKTRLRYLGNLPVESQKALGITPEFLRQQEAMLGSTTSGGSKADPRFKVEKVAG